MPTWQDSLAPTPLPGSLGTEVLPIPGGDDTTVPLEAYPLCHRGGHPPTYRERAQDQLSHKFLLKGPHWCDLCSTGGAAGNQQEPELQGLGGGRGTMASSLASVPSPLNVCDPHNVTAASTQLTATEMLQAAYVRTQSTWRAKLFCEPPAPSIRSWEEDRGGQRSPRVPILQKKVFMGLVGLPTSG